MTDRAELDIAISAQVDRALAGISSFERSLATIERAHGMASTAAVQHSNALTQLEGKVGSLTGKLGSLVNIGTGFAIFEALKTGFDAFKSVEQFNIDIAHMTTYLQGNATAASTWMQVSELMGISVQTIDRAFVKLATDMNASSSPALRQMGISATTASGQLRPLNDVINQSADYFHAHAGASNNAALANQLFGRSGYELLPLLEKGRAGLNAVTEEARKYGLVLSAEAIQRNLQFTYELKSSEVAVRGLGISIANAALPAVAMLAKGFDQLVEKNLPAITADIERAAYFLSGFISQITGMSMTLDKGAIDLGQLSTASGDMGTQMASSGAGAQALADAIAKVRDRTKEATDAIDRQIARLNAQSAAEHFMDQQAKLQQDLANKAHDIDGLRRQQYQQFWLGNFATAKDIGDQITKDQQDQAGIQLQLSRGVEDEATKNKIASLEKQKQSLQDAMQKQVDAMQKAGQAGAAAFGGAIDTLVGHASKIGKAAGLTLGEQMAAAAGTDAAKKIQDAILGPDTVDRFGRHARLGGQGFIAVGNAIGDAIASGITTSLGKDFTNWVNGMFLPSLKAWIALEGTAGSPFGALRLIPGLNFDRGGTVPGPPGAPRFAIVHGGEEIRTPEQQASYGIGANALPRLVQQASDMGETNGLLREQNRLLRQLVAGAAGGSTTGGLAALSNLIENAGRSRARGMAGS